MCEYGIFVYVYEGQTRPSGVLLPHWAFFSRDRVLLIGRVAALGLSDPPGYTPQCWSYRPMQTHPVFNVGSGDLNCLHACLASSFTC